MSYRKLDQVQHFLQWLRDQNDRQVLSRALIGGFFIYPPPPVTLETYMKNRRGQSGQLLESSLISGFFLLCFISYFEGELGFLQGAELQRELKQFCYRERRTFIIQATVAMVIYSRRGQVSCQASPKLSTVKYCWPPLGASSGVELGSVENYSTFKTRQVYL